MIMRNERMKVSEDRVPAILKTFLASTSNIERIYYVRSRWEDEKEHEDFEEYRSAIIAMFEDAGFSGVTMSKSFVVRCSDDSRNHFELRVNLRGLTYKVIPAKPQK